MADPRCLPADLEIEILSYLPAKALLRFKSVSKSWSLLISSRRLIALHNLRSPPRLLTLRSESEHFSFQPDRRQLLLLYHDFNAATKFSKKLPQAMYNADRCVLHFSSYADKSLNSIERFHTTLPKPLFDGSMCGKPFMLSCRGLVCIASWSSTCQPIYLLNPATREIVSLPPSKEPNLRVGFGYAAYIQEFKKVVRFENKVVRFFELEDERTGCQVFTLGSSQWRDVVGIPYRVCDGTAPFVRGAVHCLPETSRTGVKGTDAITVFDLASEEYREAIAMPPQYYTLGQCDRGCGIMDWTNFKRLTMLRGTLCLTLDFGELGGFIDCFLLNYEKVEWVFWNRISLGAIYTIPSRGLWTYPADNMVDESILLNCADEQGVKLLGCDPPSNVASLVRDKEWAATFYEESLYPLRTG